MHKVWVTCSHISCVPQTSKHNLPRYAYPAAEHMSIQLLPGLATNARSKFMSCTTVCQPEAAAIREILALPANNSATSMHLSANPGFGCIHVSISKIAMKAWQGASVHDAILQNLYIVLPLSQVAFGALIVMRRRDMISNSRVVSIPRRIYCLYGLCRMHRAGQGPVEASMFLADACSNLKQTATCFLRTCFTVLL